MHAALKRLLKRSGIADPSAPPPPSAWHALIEHLGKAFAEYDQERYLHERSMAISNREMEELNASIQRSSQQQIAQERDTLRTILDSLGEGLCSIELDCTLSACNPEAARLLGRTEAELHGFPFITLFAVHDSHHAQLEASVRKGQPCRSSDGSMLHANGSSFPAAYTLTPLVTGQQVRGAVLLFQDITEQRHVEDERLRLQQEIVSMQAALLAELSTPLIPISDKVVIMPLIGSIDSNRAQRVLETLLHGIVQYQAQRVIIDITGVSLVDTHVANGLIHAAQAVQLLGARVTITGIRPEIAQTLVGLGMSLSGITTRSTLRDAVALALRQ